MADLNPQQEMAVQHVEGPLLVLAGAGSGKTRVVTHRIAHLIDRGVLPERILAVTFTNRAAEEMRSRIRNLKNAHVLASTFHSLGARILREAHKADFAIYDEEDSGKLLKKCLEQLGLSTDDAKLLRGQISSAKNDLIAPEDVKNDALLAQSYLLYQEKLGECNAVDFDDLLYLTVKILRENEDVRRIYQTRWQFVLIDEYQDTNLAQYTLTKLLVETHRNLFAVGDPDQSIYSWRGARYQNILNFGSDFPGAKIITLDQNYRSTNTILKGANALICHNENRFDKKLWSALGEGSKISTTVAFNERQEALFVAENILRRGVTPLDDIAIFYRTNAQSRPFEDVLLSKKIPYEIIGGVSFYERKEVKDLLAYLRMVVSDTDLISFLRTINVPKRGLGAATLDKIVQGAAEAHLPILNFCEHCQGLKLGAKQKASLQSYLHLIQQLRNRQPHMKIFELMQEVVSLSGYLNYLQGDPETAQERKENIDELLGKAAEWEEEQEQPSLSKFLEELALRIPAPEKEHVPSIKMMTLHNSKGLEFSIVFFVGMEEELLPHINSKDDPSAIEEERRLCYVGMTRAKKQLYLSSAIYRYMWGHERLMRPSRFLKEIPPEYMQTLKTV